MIFFREKPKYLELNTLMTGLKYNSKLLIKLGKEVFADIEYAKKERLNYINPKSGRLNQAQSEWSEENYEASRQRNIKLLEKISKDYDRLQYLITLVGFVAENYKSVKPHVTYFVEPRLVLTLGEQAKTKAVLEEIIEKYNKENSTSSEDHEVQFDSDQALRDTFYDSSFLTEFSQRDNDTSAPLVAGVATGLTPFLQPRVSRYSNEDSPQDVKDVSEVDSRYLARDASYRDMSTVLRNTKIIVDWAKRQDSLVNDLSKHYKNRKTLAQLLFALSITIFIVGVVLLILGGGTVPGIHTVFPGFVMMMVSGATVPFSGNSFDQHRARYETSVHLTKPDLQDNYSRFIDKVRESESITETAVDLKNEHAKPTITTLAILQ